MPCLPRPDLATCVLRRLGECLFDAGGNLLAASPAAGAGTGCALNILCRRGAGGDSSEDVVSGRSHAGADELG